MKTAAQLLIRCKKANKNVVLLYTMACFSIASPSLVYGQCTPDLHLGINLVKNGDFSDLYNDWSHDPQYSKFVLGGFSVPGIIYAGTDPRLFNAAFTNDYPDHSPSADDRFLMVDGLCIDAGLNVKLWKQDVPVKAGQIYHFSLWISSLKNNPNYPGELNFDIDGVDIGNIKAPTTGGTAGNGGGWIPFEVTWTNTGADRTVTISIENMTPTGCSGASGEADFGIDDIQFIPGCSYSDLVTPAPALGTDRTLCGNPAGITLNTGQSFAADLSVTWSSNITPAPAGNGTTAAPHSVNITAPGTYAVCLKKGSGCIKQDIIVVNNTFAVDLSDVHLCSPSSTTLDAGYTATGVTYQWYKESNGTVGWQITDTVPTDGKGKTYFVNSAGEYKVDVTDIVCGVRSGQATVTSTAPVPGNMTYCNDGSSVTVSVSGPGTFRWFSTPAKPGGVVLGNGTTYTTPALSAPNDYTYYVEDIASFAGNAGPSALIASGLTNWGINPGLQQKINISQDVSITALKIPIQNISNSTGTITIEVLNAAGASFSPAKTFTSNPATLTTAQEGTLVPFTFTGFDLDDAWGNDLRLVAIAKTFNGNICWNQNPSPAPVYPSPATGAFRVVGGAGGNAADDDYVHFYDIQYQAGIPCDRVPVTVTHSCPLPVELVNFKAELKSSKVTINWITSSEAKNDYFAIQRSPDGIAFESIGRVIGQGTTSLLNEYQYIDYHPLGGLSYYRIVQYDQDGTAHTGPVEAVNNQLSSIKLSPNPTQGNVEVSFHSEADAEIRMYICNQVGGIVYEEKISASPGYFSRQMNLTHLTPGIYTLHVEGAVQKSIVRIIKD